MGVGANGLRRGFPLASWGGKLPKVSFLLKIIAVVDKKVGFLSTTAIKMNGNGNFSTPARPVVPVFLYYNKV